jgi:spore coat polysaccharide biosynthesis protein SpsF
MKTVIIVQARMTSTRLPGKVLKEVLGKPLLEYQIERMQQIKTADEIVIATTVNATDEPIVDLCRRLGVAYYRGSEEDVLARYYGAATDYKADIVVRITADCPVIDPEVSNETIRYYLNNLPKYDYVSIDGYPRGLDTEVFSYKVLAEAYRQASEKPEREHVTSFFYRSHPERYRIQRLKNPQQLEYHRWTVDTPADFELISRIIENIYQVKKDFNYADILDILTKNPGWIKINAEVKQKAYGESTTTTLKG